MPFQTILDRAVLCEADRIHLERGEKVVERKEGEDEWESNRRGKEKEEMEQVKRKE